MENIAGPPVEGKNFFGRDDIVEELQLDLEHHDVLLLGPRRIGKTSAARAVLAAVRKKGWRGFEVNVAACPNEAAFVSKLTRAITTQVVGRSGNRFGVARKAAAALLERVDRIRLPGGGEIGLVAAESEDWSGVANDALRLLAEDPSRWLVYIDELPILLHSILRADPDDGVARVRRFLDWFRNEAGSQPGMTRVRWLITGSVGLDTLVQRHGMADTINTLRHRGLRPFARPVAVAMLAHLGTTHEVHLKRGHIDHIVDAIGWPQPYYLQRVFHTLRARAHAGGAITTKEIERAVGRLTHDDQDNDFHHWESRLTTQLGAVDAAHAIAMLTRASATKEGTRGAFLFDCIAERLAGDSTDVHRKTYIGLRSLLLRDQYLTPDGEGEDRRFRFLLEPLRAWWLQRHTL